LFFIQIFPKSKKFWKGIDYWWISLGVIGIFGSTFSLRKEYVEARRKAIDSYFFVSYSNFQESISGKKIYFSKNFLATSPEDSILIQEMRNTSIYLDSLLEKSKKFNGPILLQKKLEYIDSLEYDFNRHLSNIKDLCVKDVCSDLLFSFEDLKYSKNEHIENDRITQKNSYHWSLLFLSPYILAIALGIRLTKVTAEIKELQSTK
jgi:hypothetical protein